MGGAHGNAENAAGFRIQSARDVECQQRAAECAERVELFHQRRVVSCQRTVFCAEADAEQAVDGETILLCGYVGMQRAASAYPGIMRGVGIGRQLVDCAGKHHDGLEAALFQEPGDHQGVAAVVAGSGDDQRRSRRTGQQPQREFGCRRAGPLHQRRIGLALALFDVAQRGEA